ncbi:hypothetical protein AB4486_24815, partial [Vibrio sp. 10N.222.55.C6]
MKNKSCKKAKSKKRNSDKHIRRLVAASKEIDRNKARLAEVKVQREGKQVLPDLENIQTEWFRVSNEVLNSKTFISLKHQLELLEVKSPKDKNPEQHVHDLYKKASTLKGVIGFELIGELAVEWDKLINYRYGRCRYHEGVPDNCTITWNRSVWCALGDLMRLQIGNHRDVMKLFYGLVPSAIEEIKAHLETSPVDWIEANRALEWLYDLNEGQYKSPPARSNFKLLVGEPDINPSFRTIIRLGSSLWK